jgi:3-deoxy-D-manno-octulosonic-acid transferase
MIFIYLLFLAPKLLWERLKGKRHPGWKERLGLSLPNCPKGCIWIHAVSLGEVKAAESLLRELAQTHHVLLTTTTATGQAAAKKTAAHTTAYAPLDAMWIVKRWARHLQPSHYILIESDFWPNLLKALQEQGTKIVLANGKMSLRSFERYRFFHRFSKRLFSRFDALAVQNEEYAALFRPFASKVHVTGNLKYDITPTAVEPLSVPQPALAVACTHPGEEELLLSALMPGSWFLILAPRHPERFEEVARLLERKKIAFSRWGESITGSVLLVDRMGHLPACYAACRLAILGGSFIPHIGGHNLLEPLLYGAPVLFGPYTDRQRELAADVVNSGAGCRVPVEQLRAAVEKLLAEPKRSMETLLTAKRGAAIRTLKIIKGLEENRLLG